MTRWRCFLILIFLVIISCNDTSEHKGPLDRADIKDSLKTLLEAERNRSDSLLRMVKKQDSLDEGYPLFFGKEYDDIQNPEEYIKIELRNQPEIIPLSGVLGGTMAFRKIEVLSEKWVLAIYDDGHIQGKAIFEYELQPDGIIDFTLVATQNN